MAGEQELFRFLDGEQSHFSAHGGKTFKKGVEIVPPLDVIEQGADQDSCVPYLKSTIRDPVANTRHASLE